jgi:Putative peptidoglycan binding domain
MAVRSRHRLLILGISVAAAAGIAGWLWAHNSGSGRITTGSGGCDTTVYPPPASSTTGIPSTTTTTPPSSTSSTSTTSTTSSSEVLHDGDQGPAVLALQRRLSDLGYWLGDIDGRYGSSTVHAVVAFQKAQGMARDGTAGSATLDVLSRAARLQPRSHSGRLIEIDLSRQLLLVVADGRVDWVMDACTGARPGSTPIGVFHVFRQVNGYDRSPL